MQTHFWRVVLMIGLAAFGAQAAEETVFNFDQDAEGVPPKGWTTAIAGEGTPRWEVQKDLSAPSAPNVLKQSGWAPNPSFPLCVRQDESLQNGFLEVKFKPLSGTNDQAAGLVWRYKDSKNYYIARANALEDNVVLYRVENGQRKALDILGRKGGYGVKASVPKLQWSKLRVEFVGSQFAVFLNDKKLFTVEDATFPEKGAVGLWTKADSVTLFDDFRFGTALPHKSIQ